MLNKMVETGAVLKKVDKPKIPGSIWAERRLYDHSGAPTYAHGDVVELSDSRLQALRH